MNKITKNFTKSQDPSGKLFNIWEILNFKKVPKLGKSLFFKFVKKLLRKEWKIPAKIVQPIGN
jgi:hypothetical protein